LRAHKMVSDGRLVGAPRRPRCDPETETPAALWCGGREGRGLEARKSAALPEKRRGKVNAGSADGLVGLIRDRRGRRRHGAHDGLGRRGGEANGVSRRTPDHQGQKEERGCQQAPGADGHCRLRADGFHGNHLVSCHHRPPVVDPHSLGARNRLAVPEPGWRSVRGPRSWAPEDRRRRRCRCGRSGADGGRAQRARSRCD